MPTLRELLADGRVHVVDGAMGTMLYGRGRVPQRLLRRAEPQAARPRARHPPGVRPGRRRDHRDEHLRRQPDQAGDARPRRRHRADQRRGGPAGARCRRRPRRGGRGDRPARRAHRAVRRDVGGRGARAPSRRQVRGLLAGGVDGFILETFSDVAELGAAFAAVRAVVGSAGHRADDRRHRRQDPLRHRPRRLRPRAGGDGRRRDRRQLLGRAARRARGGRKARARGGHPDLGAAERRPAARGRRPQDVHGVSRVHGELRAPHGRGRRATSWAGCCGTTPEHIRAIVGFVQSVSPRHVHAVAGAAPTAVAQDPVPLAERSRLGCKLARGTVRHDGRDRAAQGRRSDADVRAGAAAQGRGRRRRQRARMDRGPRAGWARCSRRS